MIDFEIKWCVGREIGGGSFIINGEVWSEILGKLLVLF